MSARKGELAGREPAGTHIPLTLRGGGNKQLVLATLSWGAPTLREARVHTLSADAFLTTIRAAAQHLSGADLVVCAGMTVEGRLDTARVQDTAGGVPLLFERWDGSKASWLIASDQHKEFVTLRARQMISRHDAAVADRQALLRALAHGGGWLKFDGFNVPLVLLICGENNVFVPTGASIFKTQGIGATLRRSLSRRFSGPWIAINAAHKAYWPQVVPRGFAKVGQVRRKAGPSQPILQAVADGRSRADGTVGPVAVIHTNNFIDDRPATTPFASKSFAAHSNTVSILHTHGPQRTTPTWLLSVYRLQENAS